MEKIDFVLAWVDGSDEKWLRERAKYDGAACKEDVAESRFRDWDNLQYLFRGIEKFAPWVHKVYLVTYGHIPSWLNLSHPKLRVIRHEEYIPAEYLPTFNSHTIELNFHRIEDLSEHFVYFNDDMFLIRDTSPEDFFKNGLPRECCVETALMQDDYENAFAHILMNNMALINMHFDKRKIIRQNPLKWFHPVYGLTGLRNFLMLPYSQFSGFKYTHLPSPFLKSTFNKVWDKEGKILDQVCSHKFRSAQDVNQYVMKYWQCMEGNYIPQSPGVGKFCLLGRDDAHVTDIIENQKKKMICINDSAMVGDFEKMKTQIQNAFQKILPEKSGFETQETFSEPNL